MPSLHFLDCHSIETMLSSVSAAIGRTDTELAAAIEAYDDGQRPKYGDVLAFMPQATLASIGVDITGVSFAGTHWFHGTRTLDPERFRRYGILPLPQIVDWLWDSLYGLARAEIEPARWEAFRESVEQGKPGPRASHYAHEMSFPDDRGPLGELIRDVFLNPERGRRDSLAIPEIVEDIAIEAQAAFGLDLGDRFSRAASPCLVKFRTATFERGALDTALVYGWKLLTGNEVLHGAHYTFSGYGAPIPARDVLGTEIVRDG